MNSAIRLAPSAAFLVLLLLGCETEEEVFAPATDAALFASTGSLTSAVTDPEGDVVGGNGAGGGRAYQDIVRAEITKRGTSFVLTMEMAGAIPETPELPGGIKLLTWTWRLNPDLQTFPAGFPHAPGIPAPPEYMVQILWDGMGFFAQLIDRTPLLAGGDAILTPLAFRITRGEFKTSVDAGMIGDPSTFRWSVETQNWTGPLGTEGWLFLDVAPALDAGEPPATWPS